MIGHHNKKKYIAILFLKERVINFDHFASISKLTRKHVRIGNMYYRLLEELAYEEVICMG
jgi:hypothetical protein